MNPFEQQPTDCFICRKHRGEVSIPGGAIYEKGLLPHAKPSLQQPVEYWSVV